MAQAGHEVTVFCRTVSWAERSLTFQGMRLVYVPAIRQKHLETLSHTAASLVRLPRQSAVICMGVGNAPLVRLYEVLSRHRMVFNVDGADWQRPKWEAPARAYLRRCEWLAATGNSLLVADARSVQDHFTRSFGRATELVAYGAEPPRDSGIDALIDFGLESGEYILYVGRLVPENGAHEYLDGVAQSGLTVPAVVVGDAPYAAQYIASLHRTPLSTSVFTGYQFGRRYQQLTAHAGVFVLAASVGGTHPVLLEQMAAGNCILARETASNLEVLGDAGLFWKNTTELGALLRQVWPDFGRRRVLGRAAQDRVNRLYSWDEVTDQYLRLCGQVI
jgi:glycosyltransferase involved in cell wall biosynthesis